MIARPKMSQIEWKTIEIRGFTKVGSPFSLPRCCQEVEVALARTRDPERAFDPSYPELQDYLHGLLDRDRVVERNGQAVRYSAGKGCEIPNLKGSYLGRFPLVSANFGTSDHLSERSRSVTVFSGRRARGGWGTLTLKRR